jgi:hypothetical protein
VVFVHHTFGDPRVKDAGCGVISPWTIRLDGIVHVDDVVVRLSGIDASHIFIEDVIWWGSEHANICVVCCLVAKSGEGFESRHVLKGGRIVGNEQNRTTKNSPV